MFKWHEHLSKFHGANLIAGLKKSTDWHGLLINYIRYHRISIYTELWSENSWQSMSRMPHGRWRAPERGWLAKLPVSPQHSALWIFNLALLLSSFIDDCPQRFGFWMICIEYNMNWLKDQFLICPKMKYELILEMSCPFLSNWNGEFHLITRESVLCLCWWWCGNVRQLRLLLPILPQLLLQLILL